MTVSRETPQRRIAILGTGTDVGKTHVGVVLTAALAAAGHRVSGLKPIESGVTAGMVTDADRLAAVSSVAAGPAPFRFADPVSPHLAARRAGVTISVGAAVEWVAAQPAEIVVVETAGGLMSPLGPGLTNVELVRALRPQWLVLVGLDRLGVLHDVGAALQALRALGPELGDPTVVLNEPVVPDASTGTNAGELKLLGIADEVEVLPRGDAVGSSRLASVQRLLADAWV